VPIDRWHDTVGKRQQRASCVASNSRRSIVFASSTHSCDESKPLNPIKLVEAENRPLEGLIDSKAFAAYLRPLHNTKWVVYCKRPFGGPKEVLRYLARYTHRVFIQVPSNGHDRAASI
jgi:Putative transposase